MVNKRLQWMKGTAVNKMYHSIKSREWFQNPPTQSSSVLLFETHVKFISKAWNWTLRRYIACDGRREERFGEGFLKEMPWTWPQKMSGILKSRPECTQGASLQKGTLLTEHGEWGSNEFWVSEGRQGDQYVWERGREGASWVMTLHWLDIPDCMDWW